MVARVGYSVDMTTHPNPTAGTAGEKEATMAATHTTTVTCVAPAPFGGGDYQLTCTCGEKVTYRGEQFTQVEARRHQAWHAKTGR
jgi:hypothetical protein